MKKSGVDAAGAVARHGPGKRTRKLEKSASRRADIAGGGQHACGQALKRDFFQFPCSFFPVPAAAEQIAAIAATPPEFHHKPSPTETRLAVFLQGKAMCQRESVLF